MRLSLRHILAATTMIAGALAAGPVLAQKAAAPAASKAAAPQAAEQAPQEVAVTQAQIDGLVAAQPELAKIQGGDSDKPDPKVLAKVEEIVKKHGFASGDEFSAVSDSIDAVLSGFDPEARKFVGASALIKKDIAALNADKQTPAKEKAAALKELKQALAAGDGPKPSEANIALVAKNFDKLGQNNQSAEAGAK